MKIYDVEARHPLEHTDGRVGDLFMMHMNQMTAENLHSKSDIAIELAWRDYQLEKIKADIGSLFHGLEGCTNHGCIVAKKPKNSLGTNGFCSCLADFGRTELTIVAGRLSAIINKLD